MGETRDGELPNNLSFTHLPPTLQKLLPCIKSPQNSLQKYFIHFIGSLNLSLLKDLKICVLSTYNMNWHATYEEHFHQHIAQHILDERLVKICTTSSIKWFWHNIFAQYVDICWQKSQHNLTLALDWQNLLIGQSGFAISKFWFLLF